MEWFSKAMSYTIAIGFALMGVYVGLLVLRLAIGVAGFMLGSALGTVILAMVMWHWYKKHKEKGDFPF